MRKIIAEETAQGKVEYALIISLIALAVLIVLVSPDFRCAIKGIYVQTAYEIHLASNKADDSEAIFNQFMIENGFDTSEFEYIDGKIKCSGSSNSTEPEDPEPNPDPDPVPWL